MSDDKEPRSSIGRSILALVVGIVAGIAVTTITDVALHAAGVFAPWGQPVSDKSLVLATAYRVVYGVGASYVIAWLAPNRPMLHALIGGALGVVANTVGAVVTWNGGPQFGAHWYPIALILTAMPCAWLGGKLWLMRVLTTVVP
jgi:hypothetical protein